MTKNGCEQGTGNGEHGATTEGSGDNENGRRESSFSLIPVPSIPVPRRSSSFVLRHSTLERSDRRGFSLLELLIASLILGLGLIMVAGMFPVALDQHRRSANQIMAMQVALGAKRLVHTHLVPHIDPLRRFRSLDGSTDEFEAGARGPVRWDPPLDGSFSGPSLWHLLHFETIVVGDRNGVEPATRLDKPTLTYADGLNEARSPMDALRPAWFRIADTVSPPVRLTAGADVLATPSYAWYTFYQRPSSDPTSTHLAYFVAICRVDGGARFAFQDLTEQGTGSPPRRVDPRPASTTLLSRLPVPWLVNVRGGPPETIRLGAATGGGKRRGVAGANVAQQVTAHSQNLFREANRDGRVQPWQNDVRLYQLAPRGTRLIGQVTGTVYTVMASPARRDLVGTPIDVLPQPSSRDTAVWLFPPPVVVDNGRLIWQPRSPFVTGLQF